MEKGEIERLEVGTRNENGGRIVNFFWSTGTVVLNITFPKKRKQEGHIQKWREMVPGGPYTTSKRSKSG